jgi:sirohydrochlorin cobaltochelatase
VVNLAHRFLNASLVLVGHGSTKNPDSRQSVERHAAELRRRNLFRQVLACFYKETPYVRDLRHFAPSGELFVIPVFMGEGYFARQIIPRELGLTDHAVPGEAHNNPPHLDRIRYGRPVGTHPAMTQVVLARAENIIRQHPSRPQPQPSEIALVIAGHGTTRDEQSREVIDRQVEVIRGMRRYAEVHAAFIEEEPSIADCHSFVEAPHIVVVPFFVSDGMHVQEDIPVLLGEPAAEVHDRLRSGQPTWANPTTRRGKQIWCAGSVGTEPLLAEVILERTQELARACVEGNSLLYTPAWFSRK